METGVFVAHLLACFLLSFFVNWGLLRKRPATRRKQSQQQVRWNSQSKPAMGGFSFMAVTLLALLGAMVWSSLASWEQDAPAMLPTIGGILLASLLAFGVGIYDDAYHTRPRTKLIMQFACAGILLWSGIQIDCFDLQWLNVVLSVVWVVGLMNAVNMLDNMDGIASTVSIFICLFVVMVSLGVHQEIGVATWIFAGLASGLFGFLMFNWHPSKMYMGDGGSMLLGVLLASGTMSYAWNLVPAPFEGRQLLIPGLVLLMPIADTTVVTVNRLLHEVSPSTGGRDHTTHNLSYLGLPDNMVAVVFSFLSMISTTLALILAYGEADRMTTFGSVLWMSLVILGFFVISRFNLARGKYSYKKR